MIDVFVGIICLLVGIICEVIDVVLLFCWLKLELGVVLMVWSDEVIVGGIVLVMQVLEVCVMILENGQSQMFVKYIWVFDVNG